MNGSAATDFPCRDGEGDVCGECEACVESYEAATAALPSDYDEESAEAWLAAEYDRGYRDGLEAGRMGTPASSHLRVFRCSSLRGLLEVMTSQDLSFTGLSIGWLAVGWLVTKKRVP